MNDQEQRQSVFDALRSFRVPIPEIPEPVIKNLGEMPTVHEETNEHLGKIEQDQRTLLGFVHDSLEHLIDTIKESDKKSEALGNKMLWLSYVGLFLAATQIIPAIETLRSWFHWW